MYTKVDDFPQFDWSQQLHLKLHGWVQSPTDSRKIWFECTHGHGLQHTLPSGFGKWLVCPECYKLLLAEIEAHPVVREKDKVPIA